MRSIQLAALVFTSAAAPLLFAAYQDAPAAPHKTPPAGVLHSVSVKGNSRYSTEEIVKETGLHLGQKVNSAALEEARVKLQATELFNGVAFNFRFSGSVPPEYDVVYDLQENDQVFPMRFERLNASPEAIRAYLQSHVPFYSDHIPGAAGVLNRYKAAVQDFIRESNPSVKVKALVSNDDPAQLAVLFTPDTPPPVIAQVQVSGNVGVDTGTILRAVNQVAIGVPVTDARLKEILDGTMRRLFANKGYAAVTFPKIETVPATTNQSVILKITIQDGPQFKFGAIHFHGTGLAPDDIRAAIPFKPGQIYNGDQVDSFRVDMMHKLRRKGLLDATVTTESQANDANKTVDVTYNFVPGETYNFGQLDVKGLDAGTQPVIEKLWGEKPGKPFNPDYPDYFLKKVEEQGLFDHLAETRSDYTADSSTHNVVVHLYFKGGEPKKDAMKKAQEQKEKNGRSDGTWSPWPGGQ